MEGRSILSKLRVSAKFLNRRAILTRRKEFSKKECGIRYEYLQLGRYLRVMHPNAKEKC